MAKDKGEMVIVCPKCGGKDVADNSWALGQRYFCYTCGFLGTIFPMITKKEASRIKLKKRRFFPSWDSFVSPFPGISGRSLTRRDILINKVVLLLFFAMLVAVIAVLCFLFYSQITAPATFPIGIVK